MESRQLGVYLSLLVMFAAATATLALRLVARHLMRMRPWWDDWLAVTAFVRDTPFVVRVLT